jgi:hypothetical protein
MSAQQERQVAKLSLRAVKALTALEGVGRNPLSPLAVLNLEAIASDPEEAAAQLESMDGSWEWAAPALVDPQRSVGLLYADPEHARVGQHVFPDVEGAGPAFSVDVSSEGLRMSGPWSLGEIEFDLLKQFTLEAVADSEPVRLELTRRQLWGLAACVDAYRVARLTRELMRGSALPEGLTVPEIAEAWVKGLAQPNPEWSVSMMSLLGPDTFTADFAVEIPGVLVELASAGLLRKVELGDGNPAYAPEGALKRLCLEVGRSNAAFGLVFRRLREPGKVQATMVFGWRTAEGIWVTDVGVAGSASEGRTALLQVGPYFFAEYVNGLVGEEPRKTSDAAAFSMETPYSRDALVAALRAAREPASSPVHPAPDTAAPPGSPGSPPRPSFCGQCGSPLVPGSAYCIRCGAKV